MQVQPDLYETVCSDKWEDKSNPCLYLLYIAISCNASLGSCYLDFFVKNIMELFENTTAFFNHCISAYYVCLRMNKCFIKWMSQLQNNELSKSLQVLKPVKKYLRNICEIISTMSTNKYYLLTEIEVITGTSQTETVVYAPNSSRTIRVVIYKVSTTETTIFCLTWSSCKSGWIRVDIFHDHCSWNVLQIIIKMQNCGVLIHQVDCVCRTLFKASMKLFCVETKFGSPNTL